MRIGITAKLYLAIFATALVVVAVMALAQRYAFELGFLAYVNRMEVARVQSLTETLGANWREHGDWSNLEGRQRRWLRLLFGSLKAAADRGRPHPPPGEEAGAAGRPSPDFLGPAPAAEPFARAQGSFERPGPPPDGHRGPPPHMRMFDPIHLGPRLTLLDAGKRYVVGNPRPDPDAALKPIAVDGTTIGYLAVTPFRRLTSSMDKRFAEHQRDAALVIAAFALLIAAAVAVPLSRHLLKPVHALARGTRTLTAGDFSARVPATSGDELGQLARDFNVLARTLEANEGARRQFMADVSHELRTPLAVLRGELEALEDGIRAPTPEAIASLQHETRALAKLVDDLYALALADIGALTYRYDDVDVGELVTATVAAVRDAAAARGIEVATTLAGDGALVAFADADRLRQLLAGLLDNALRYTAAPGRVEIACGREGGHIAIDVRDSAPGVADADLPRLFERFYRVEGSRSREHGGAGLGLAICRSIVAAHGGMIEARPSPLGGLWIAVRLPVAGPAQGAPA